MLNNFTLPEIRKLAEIGKKLCNKTVDLPTKNQILQARKHIEKLSGNSFVHSNYARNVLIAISIANPKLIAEIKSNKRIYINSYVG